eukprot:gene24291-biopygen20887
MEVWNPHMGVWAHAHAMRAALRQHYNALSQTTPSTWARGHARRVHVFCSSVGGGGGVDEHLAQKAVAGTSVPTHRCGSQVTPEAAIQDLVMRAAHGCSCGTSLASVRLACTSVCICSTVQHLPDCFPHCGDSTICSAVQHLPDCFPHCRDSFCLTACPPHSSRLLQSRPMGQADDPVGPYSRSYKPMLDIPLERVLWPSLHCGTTTAKSRLWPRVVAASGRPKAECDYRAY